MKLMTLEEFKKTPNYTLFSVCRKDDVENGYYSGNITDNAEGPFIKTGTYVNHPSGIEGWNGVIDLFPDNIIIDEKRSISNWCSWDNADADYMDDEYVFIVYESSEIQQMINILSVALGKDAKLPDYDKFYGDDKEISIKELLEFAGIKDDEKFDYGPSDSNLHELIRKYILSTK